MKRFQNNAEGRSIALRLVVDGVLWVLFILITDFIFSKYFSTFLFIWSSTGEYGRFINELVPYQTRLVDQTLLNEGLRYGLRFIPSYLVGGFLIGIAQWIVLIRHGEKSWRWLFSTILGYMVGGVLGTIVNFTLQKYYNSPQQDFELFFLATYVSIAISSTIIGLAQWWVLRRIVEKAWPWVFIVIASHVADFALNYGSSPQFPWVEEIITGAGIVILLWINYTRYSSETEEMEKEL